MQAFARAASAASFCAALLPAQPTSPARDLGFGMVRQSDGTPWPGALVQLVHRPDPELLDESITDRIEVFTDERGRFRAELLDGARYAVWARAPLPDALGRYRATASAALEVRTPVVLDEAEPRFARRIRVVPDPSWEGRETLRLFATAGDSGLGPGRWLDPDEPLVFHLPPGPDSELHVEVYAGGWRVHRMAVALAPAGRRSERLDDAALLGTADGLVLALGRELAVQVPPRRIRTFRLTRQSDGQPVLDAVALVDQAPAEAPELHFDSAGNFDIPFAATAPLAAGGGLQGLVAGATTEHLELDSTMWSAEAGTREVALADGHALRGRLLVAETPVAAAPLRAWIVDPKRRNIAGRDLVVRTDRDGGFTVPGLGAGDHVSLVAILPVAARERLAGLRPGQSGGPGDGAPPFAPSVVVHAVGSPAAGSLGDVDLAHLAELRIEVEQDGAAPAESVELWCCDAPTSALRHPPPVALRTSRHGTLRFLRRAGSRPGFVAEADGRFAAGRMEPDRPTLRLALDPRSVARIRILDPGGEPLLGRPLLITRVDTDRGDDFPLDATIRHALRGQPVPTTDLDGIARVSLGWSEGRFKVTELRNVFGHQFLAYVEVTKERDPETVLPVARQLIR